MATLCAYAECAIYGVGILLNEGGAVLSQCHRLGAVVRQGELWVSASAI